MKIALDELNKIHLIIFDITDGKNIYQIRSVDE